jgi:aspartate aminotransferase
MNVRLSRRAAAQPASPIRRLAPFAAEARELGRHVFQLNIGQPDIAAPREVLERLRSFDQPNVAYGPSEGLPEFLAAIQDYYTGWGLAYDRRELFATTGGSEALLFTLAAIADHGDDVLVFEPFYANYSGFAAMVGVHTRPVTTYAEDGYHLPGIDKIEAQIGPKTRAILLCSPNNPTGTVYTDEELEGIGELCRKHGLYLVADEVYREFTYDGARHRSAATLEGLDQQIVLTDSLSKRVSLCGARVGWIASKNSAFMDAVLRFGQARLCPPTLGQYMGAVFNRIGDEYMNSVVAEYEKRRDLVFAALDVIPGVLVKRPEGAFYLCAKLPIDDAQKFAEFLLRDFEIDGETVMLAPADGFYATAGAGLDEVRIAYVLNTAELARAMEIIRAALEAYPGTTSKG